jgi:carbamoyl-phosphate synthase large subunit
LLILRAGSAAANNLIRSLKAGDRSLYIVGCHDDRFALKKSLAYRNYLVPDSSNRAFRSALRKVIRSERIDLLVPTADADVQAISTLRDNLPCRTFLPRRSVIRLCQDKYALSAFLRRRGIPAPITYAVKRLDQIEPIFRRLAPRRRLWCRMRRGTGSLGAIPVTNSSQVRHWIKYFDRMRGVPKGSFTLSEYLPGRDFCVQCLWKDGELVLAKMAERLIYLVSGSPSGVSSTPALAKTVFEPGVMVVCENAIRALDRKASGVYFIDLKERADGTPCITEINAGRFATITNIHDLPGAYNMASTFVHLAMGDPVAIRSSWDFAEDYYLVRSVDTVPAVMHASEFFAGIDLAA